MILENVTSLKVDVIGDLFFMRNFLCETIFGNEMQ